jgi:hypothetical protein
VLALDDPGPLTGATSLYISGESLGPSGTEEAVFIESAGEPIVRAICERLERATVVALDPIVLFVAPI